MTYSIRTLTFEAAEGVIPWRDERFEIIAVLDANRVRVGPEEKWYITALVKVPGT